jgi:hypothetical protein
MKEPTLPFGARVPLPSLDLKGDVSPAWAFFFNREQPDGFRLRRRRRTWLRPQWPEAQDRLLLLLVTNNEKGRPGEPGRPPTNPEAPVFGRATCTRAPNISNSIRGGNVLKAASFRMAQRRVEYCSAAAATKQTQALPGRRAGPAPLLTEPSPATRILSSDCSLQE